MAFDNKNKKHLKSSKNTKTSSNLLVVMRGVHFKYSLGLKI